MPYLKIVWNPGQFKILGVVVLSILLSCPGRTLEGGGSSVEENPSIKVHQVTDPLFSKSKFNFSQTVGEMVFVSFEVEKMRMFLVQSVVRWYCVLAWSWGAVISFPV